MLRQNKGSIYRLRKQLGLTQKEFAAKLGVACLTVNRWENKRSKPSPMALGLLDSVIEEVKNLKPSDK